MNEQNLAPGQTPGDPNAAPGTVPPGTTPAAPAAPAVDLTPDVVKPDVTPAAPATAQPTEVETLAMQMGWNPNHDPASGREFQTAEQYILRSQEIQKTMGTQIQTLKDSQEEFRAGMQNLVQHYQGAAKIEATKIDGQIEVLNVEKEKAIEDADKDKVKQLDIQIDTLKTQKASAETPVQPAGTQPAGTQPAGTQPAPQMSAAASTWVAENPWYGPNKEMTAYADTQSDRLRGLPEDRYFTELTKTVKTMFPQNFPKTPVNPPVLPPGVRPPGGGGGEKKFSIEDLTEDQKKWATFYEKQGVMKTEAYIQELVDKGVLTKGA